MKVDAVCRQLQLTTGLPQPPWADRGCGEGEGGWGVVMEGDEGQTDLHNLK